jgi:predicted AAA+ superfamily ATPase
VVDASGRKGQFVLTGWQNLARVARITQSLAGRVARVALLPLSLAELREAGLHEPLHFWRDNTGTEVDVVIERGQFAAIRTGLV